MLEEACLGFPLGVAQITGGGGVVNCTVGMELFGVGTCLWAIGPAETQLFWQGPFEKTVACYAPEWSGMSHEIALRRGGNVSKAR